MCLQLWNLATGLCCQRETTSRMASVTKENTLCFVPKEVGDKPSRSVVLLIAKLQRSPGRPGVLRWPCRGPWEGGGGCTRGPCSGGGGHRLKALCLPSQLVH